MVENGDARERHVVVVLFCEDIFAQFFKQNFKFLTTTT